MTFRSISTTGDWQFGQGRSSYATKEAAIELNIRTRLLSWLNDCFFSMNAGVDWHNLIGAKNPGAEIGIKLQTRVILADSYGVTRINSVDTSINRSTRALTLHYNIDTIFTRGATRSVIL